MPASSAVEIHVLGDDPLARAGLVGLLRGRDDVVVVGADVPAAVVVHDLGASGWVPEVPPEAPTVALVRDTRSAAAALDLGYAGVLLRDVSPDRLAAALIAASRDLLVVDGGLAGVLSPPAPGEDEPSPSVIVGPLTPREQQVLLLLGEGLSNRRIAKRLGVSEHTAKFHVAEVLARLGAKNRTDAVVRAARQGLLSF